MNKMTVEFLQRVNDGNYEHRELKVSTVIDGDNEQILGAHAHAITKFTKDVLDGKFASVSIEQQQKGQTRVTKVEPTVKNGKGAAVPKEDIAPVAAPENSFTEKEEDSPTPEIEKSEAKPLVETVVKEKAAAKRKQAPETTAVVKGKTGKEELYDRTNDSHKNQISSWLDEAAKDWDSEDTIDTYGGATRKLVGTPFRDSKGEILESFKAALLEIVKAELA